MPVSSWVKSVEFIDATISGAVSTASYNLSKGQNYANCVPFYTLYSNNNYYDSRLTDIYFSGTTQSGIINFDRWTPRANDVMIKCYVVEFNPEQVRVQQGTFSLAGITTHTVTLPTTLSGVNRAAMTFGWKTNSTAQYLATTSIRNRILNTTSIEFYRISATSTCSGHWFLFEDLYNNYRVYHMDGSATTGQTLNINNRSTIDPLRTFILGSSTNDSTAIGNTSYSNSRIFLYSTGTVRNDKSSASYTSYWAAQIVEIQDKTKVYTPSDQALSGWTTPNSYDINFGPTTGLTPFTCNMNTSITVTAMAQGIARANFNDTLGLCNVMVGTQLTSSGTITYTKGATSYVVYPSYTVAVDWAGIEVNTGTNPNPIPEGKGAGQSFVKSVENFRFTLSGIFGAYVLTKGQIASNCAIFSSNRSNNVDTLAASAVQAFIVEPGIVCMRHWYEVNQTVVDISVVEFHPNQVRVQQLNVNNISDTTVNVPINTLSSIDKTFVLSSVFTTYGGAAAGIRYSFYRIVLTSTTNIELYKVSAGYEVVCSMFVVEDLQNNFVTKHTSQTFTTNASLYDNTQEWGNHNSFPIVTYTCDSSSDYPYYAFIRAYYVSEYRPIYADKNNASYTVSWSGTIVKILDDKKHTFALNRTIPTSPGTYTTSFPSDIAGTTNITAYNVCQYSTAYIGTNDSGATSDAFATITITNYNTGEVELSKGGALVAVTMGAQIINWVGFHYQAANNVTGTRTKSFINSIQKNIFNTDGGTMFAWLKHNQDITKCVPFISNTAEASDGNHPRMFRAIYRMEDPDGFRIRQYANSTASRKVLSYIIEFNQDVKVQYGCGYTTGASLSFNIEQVNLDRAFLVFYYNSDAWTTAIGYSSICGYFSNSTSLNFIRAITSGAISITWYVVECPDRGADSYWTVYRNLTTGQSGSTVYNWLPYQPAVERTIFFTSYDMNVNVTYPYYGIFRIYHRQDHGIQLDKSNASYEAPHINTEAVEFSSKLVKDGFKVYSNFYTLAATNPITVDLKLNAADSFHIPNSIVITESIQGTTRVDSNDLSVFPDAYHYLDFNDTTGSGYSKAINIYKHVSATTTYGFYSAIQFPEYNKYYFSGYVTEQGNPVARKLIAYKSASGNMVDTTTSNSGTGYFYLETTDYEPHHIVAMDDDGGLDYNYLIYGKIYPTIISGAFFWNMGNYTTTTGIGEYCTA